MNPFTAVTALIVLSMLWNYPTQTSLEKRAVDATQRTLASELDTDLPSLPFAEWLRKAVRQPAEAIVWQLSECGEQVEAGPNSSSDPRACVEANTILTDGRRIIVMVAVGTFKQGMTGPPAFQFGVIDNEGELRRIRRLRDLQPMILNPDKSPDKSITILPDLNNMDSANTALKKIYTPAPATGSGENAGRPGPIEELQEPPPKPPEQSTQEGLRQGGAIKKPQPVYPRNNNAKRFNAAGPVEVKVTIGITGRVSNAIAVKGHPLLRESAVEAARRWEFEPTTINGVPAETQVTLTFIFTIPPE